MGIDPLQLSWAALKRAAGSARSELVSPGICRVHKAYCRPEELLLQLRRQSRANLASRSHELLDLQPGADYAAAAVRVLLVHLAPNGGSTGGTGGRVTD
jgi:hypothetical protein